MTLIYAPDKTTQPTVILSGPTRGLGRAVFDELVLQAYPVVALGRNLERISDGAKSASAPVELVEVDLGADSDALTDTLSVVRQILSSNSIGPLVFISNASTIEPIGQARGLAFAGLELAMRINCLVPLTIANHLTESTRAQGRQLLVLDISSGAACRPIRGWQAYCTSKAAFKMGLDVLAAENSHVQVVHLDPGVMDTTMQQLIREQNKAEMPEVEVFRAYQVEGMLQAPLTVAAEIILFMKRQLT